MCLHIANDVLYPVLLLGILASKSRWTGTNPAYTRHELEHHFQISNTRYVITLPEYLETVEAAVNALDSEIEIILFTDLLSERPVLTAPLHEELRQSAELKDPVQAHTSGGKKLRTLHDLLDKSGNIDLQKHLKDLSADQIAVLMQTSGTTGLPKIAARTHGALISETKANEDNNAAKPYEVRRLFCTPIFHAFTTPEVVFNPLRLGYPTYIMKRFNNTFAQKVHDFDITETAAPPPMLMRLIQQPESHHMLQSLRLIFCGGAPLAAEQRLRTLAMFQTPPRIVQVWGMTEGGWFGTFKYPEDDDTCSVGRPIPGLEVAVDFSKPVELVDGRKAGEVRVKGPQLMTGYLGNPEASANAFDDDGWLKTGDIGYMEDGKIYLVDRAKDLIKVNGWQVAPAELEAALIQSPDVLDAAAIAIGHDVDEHPMVFVVPRDDDVRAEDIKTHLRSRLARYKVAHVELEFAQSIPRNPSGKILKKVLRAQVAENKASKT